MSAAHVTVDAETLERARGGDAEAFARLWRVYQPQLLRFLRSQRSPSVDDVASEVWIDVGRAISRFEGDGRAFQRWLFTIASRRAVDEHRRVARRPDLLEDAEAGGRRDVSGDVSTDTESGVDAAIELLRRLPPKMASVVMLRSVHELTVAETAEVVGCSEANVRVLAHRGLNRLRSFLEGGSDAPAFGPDANGVRGGRGRPSRENFDDSVTQRWRRSLVGYGTRSRCTSRRPSLARQ